MAGLKGVVHTPGWHDEPVRSKMIGHEDARCRPEDSEEVVFRAHEKEGGPHQRVQDEMNVHEHPTRQWIDERKEVVVSNTGNIMHVRT